MDKEQIHGLMEKEFPQSGPLLTKIEELGDGFVRVRRALSERNLRPGETVSGPTMMALADTTMYYLLLSMIGPVPLALTSNLNINFLRAPKLGDIFAEATMLKLGKRLAVGTVTIYTDSVGNPVAHATVTYSIPPR